MSVNVKIELTKSVYFSGELIQGKIIIFNTSTIPQRLRERISVSFDGFSKTNLLGKKMLNKNASLVFANKKNCVGEESYLSNKIFITPEDCSSTWFETGQNEFPFDFRTLVSLPSSYFCPLGAVLYEILTEFSIGHFSKVECSSKLSFRIINSQDLNLIHRARLNSYYSFEKNIPIPMAQRAQLGQEFGLINTSVEIPRQGYVPGEVIHLAINILYPRGLSICKVFAELTIEMSFRCPLGTLTESAVLDSFDTHLSRVTDMKHLVAQLEIPSTALPSSADESAHLISRKYYVTIKIQLSRHLTGLPVGKLPIIIGTVRLRQLPQQQSNLEQSNMRERETQLEFDGARSGAVFGPSAPTWNTSCEDSDTDDIPPSYMEAVGMTTLKDLRDKKI